MSSDSDDDYSYTNSVSVLKALTNKNISINSDVDTSKNNDVNFFDISEGDISVDPIPILPRKRSAKQTNKNKTANLVTIDLADDEADEDVKQKKNNNDSCILLSDDEVNVTPVNIISAIDDVLEKGKRSGRGRKQGRGRSKAQNKRKVSPRQTRQSKKLKQALKVIENSSVLNDSNVCIIEDAPDMNEVNYELTIKVYWKSQNLEKFTMRRFEKLTNIFQHFSEKENVPENRLLFTIKDKIISKNDTPDTLEITAATIIEGGILSAQTNLGNSKAQGKNKIEFKVQLKDRKHPLLISMSPEDRMEVLMFKCAEELKVGVKTLKFYFDGDSIRSSDTPNTLDLEGGEVIDCVKI